MKRSSLAFVLVTLFVAVTSAVAGAGAPSAGTMSFRLLAGDADKGSAQSKNAGTIDGRVTAISYSASTMTVASGARHVQVHVLPSTNIQGPGNAFHTIADIKKGAHVRVLMSQTGSTYNAQLITLL